MKTTTTRKEYYSSSFKRLTRKFTYENVLWWSFRILIYLFLAFIATISIYKSQEQYKIKIADYKRELKDQVYFPGITICAPTIITPKLLSSKHFFFIHMI